MNSYLKKTFIGLFFGLNVLLSFFGFSSLHNSPYTGLRLTIHDNGAVVKTVDGDSPAFEKIRPGDRLLAIGGRAVSAIAFNLDPSYNRTWKDHRAFWDEERKLEEAVAVGRPVRLRMEREGNAFEVTLTPRTFPLTVALKRTVPLYLVGWTFLIVAWLVLRRNDHEIAVANFVIGFFVCISFASLAPFAYRDIVLSLPSFRTLLITGNLGSQGFSSAAIHMLLIFPRRKRILERYPWLMAAPYLVYAIIATIHLTGVFENTYITTYFFTDTCLIVFFGSLLYNFFTEKNILYKRQIQWVVFGMLAGLAAWLGLTSIPIVFGLSFIPEEISVLPTIIYPLCFAFAVTKYRLMDIDRIFDAAVVFGFTIAILEGIELVFLGAVSKFIPFGQKAPYDSLAAVLLIVFLYVPLRGRVKGIVDRFFKRGDYDVESETQRFITSLGLRDGASPLEKFSLFVKELLGPSGICIEKFQDNAVTTFFLDGDKASLGAAAIAGAAKEVQTFFRGRQSPCYGYEVIRNGKSTDPLLKTDLENALCIPFSFAEEVSYLAVLFPKWNGTAYSSKDRSLLSAIATQVSYLLDAEQRRTSLAKISAPAVTSGIVERTRLFASLDRGRERPITWVSGPAGSGKTTLAASFLHKRGIPCLWYRVDEGDGDVATFFHYMALAAKNADPRERAPLPAYSSVYAGGLTVFTQRWFDDLYSRLTSLRDFTIVLDNFQDAGESPDFPEMILQGLARVPQGMHVMILSRQDTPPAFARLAAQEKVFRLGWDELKLAPEESGEIVRTKAGAVVTDEMAAQAFAATGGWVAGLILMLEHARTTSHDHRLPRELAHEEIFTYFADEIFEKLDTGTKTFLLKTAFLPEMTAETAERLAGTGNAWQTLYRLSRNHYFTEQYSRDGAVYRYHPLFKNFLISRAKSALTIGEVTAVQRNAASILSEAGQTEDAAALLREAGDLEGLVRLILGQAQSLMAQGRSRTLREWLDAVPQELVENTPWLLYWTGVCRFPSSYREGQRYLEKAFHKFRDTNDVTGSLLSWAGAVDAIVTEFGDLRQLDFWIEWFNDHLARNPAFPSPEIEFRVTSSMMIAHMFNRTRYDEIDPWVERAYRLLALCPDIGARLFTSTYIVVYKAWIGDLNSAAVIIEDQKRWCRSPEVAPLGILAAKYSEALYQWITGQLDFGLQAAIEGLELSAASGISIMLHHFYARAVFACLNKGDVAGATGYFDRLKEVADSTRMLHLMHYHYHYLPAWEQILRNNFSAALHDSEASLELSEKVGGSAFHQAFSRITMALALHGLREYEKADDHLKKALVIAREMKSRTSEFTCLLFKARLLFAQEEQGNEKGEEKEKGRDVLKAALKFGREEGYLNAVVWYPQAMSELCVRALAEGIETDYVRQFIRHRHLVPDRPPIEIETWPWPVKLRTLGGFELHVDDQRVTFPGKAQKKPLELLKALLSQGGRDVSELQITEVLWPDSDGDAAHSAFTTTLSRLRQLMGSERAVVIEDGKASLDPRFCWVDLWAFEKLAHDVEQTLHAEQAAPGKKDKRKDQAAVVLDMLDKVTGLYRGGYLPNDANQACTISMRERLRNKFLKLVTRAGAICEQSGQWERAMGSYQKAMETDSLNEELFQRLITCQMKLGRFDEAVTTYRLCKHTLLTAFGLTPSEKTEALYQAVLRKEK